MRHLRHRVQPGPLDLQPLRRDRARLPVHPPVHHHAELLACPRQLSEAPVALQQVRLRGHQVGLGDPHRRLRPALGLRVIRDARMHRHPVMPAHGDDLRMADRNPGDMLDGDRLLVISQRINRHPADPPQHHVQARDQRRQRPVPHGQHHPEPRPRQPRAEQQRPPRQPVRPRHHRALAPVPLQPQPRLSDPRPVRPAVHPARHRAFAAATARRVVRSFPVNPIAASRSCTMSARTLPSERSTHSSTLPRNGSISFGLAPAPSPACQIPGQRIPAHRLRIRLAQRRRRMRDASRIKRFENFHDLPVRLLHGPSGPGSGVVITATEPTPGGDPSCRTDT